jgi:hypothetical protein
MHAPCVAAPHGRTNAHALAVNRDHALELLGKAAHELRKAGLKRFRIKPAEHPAEGVVAGDAMPQAQKTTRQWLLGPTELRHIGAIFTTAQHGAEGDDQHLIQIMTDVILTWIGNCREHSINSFMKRDLR